MISLLTTKAKCPESKLELAITKINNWNDDLRVALYEWLTDDTIPEIVEQGYSIRRLMDEKNYTVIAAFMTIDWLRREPLVALDALKRKVDQIVSQPK